MTTRAWLLGSNNQKKSKEMRAILSRLGVELVTLADAAITLGVDEWGASFALNASLKALQFARTYEGVAIADDSGLSVVGLDGKPGVLSARYAGPDATDASNNLKLQAELAARPQVSRACAYHCAIAVAAAPCQDDEILRRLRTAHPPQETVAENALRSGGAYRITGELAHKLYDSEQPMDLWLFEGRWEGVVAHQAKGEGGFGYDPWVVLDDGRHVAELPDEEKNAISHRAIALEKLAQAFQS